MNINDVTYAIDDSIFYDRIVEINGNVKEIEKAAISMGYEVDSVETNDGTYDMWGWTEDTEENEQDWRLQIYPQN